MIEDIEKLKSSNESRFDTYMPHSQTDLQRMQNAEKQSVAKNKPNTKNKGLEQTNDKPKKPQQ